MWTHIAAVIDVNTYMESDDIENDVRNLLKAAPKITGSECDADVFVNVLSGHNMFTTADCNRCKYGKTIQYYDDGFDCESPEGYDCPCGEYQTRVVITVVGDLRDRTRKETKTEWVEFKNFIHKTINKDGFYINNCACNILEY
jgi:hypothetical protein